MLVIDTGQLCLFVVVMNQKQPSLIVFCSSFHRFENRWHTLQYHELIQLFSNQPLLTVLVCSSARQKFLVHFIMDNNISGIGLRFHGINPLSKYHPSKSQGIEMHNIFILCLVYNTYLFIIKWSPFFPFRCIFRFPSFFNCPTTG